MCFNLGINPMKGRFVGKMPSGEEEKGLLLKEIERWKKKQEVFSHGDPSPVLNGPNTGR